MRDGTLSQSSADTPRSSSRIDHRRSEGKTSWKAVIPGVFTTISIMAATYVLGSRQLLLAIGAGGLITGVLAWRTMKVAAWNGFMVAGVIGGGITVIVTIVTLSIGSAIAGPLGTLGALATILLGAAYTLVTGMISGAAGVLGYGLRVKVLSRISLRGS